MKKNKNESDYHLINESSVQNWFKKMHAMFMNEVFNEVHGKGSLRF